MTHDETVQLKVDRIRLEQFLMKFDENWEPGSFPSVVKSLEGESLEFRRLAVLEMIKVDLDRHWARGESKNVEEYASSLSNVGVDDAIPAPLILAEFLARHAAGKNPRASEYRKRFPKQFEEFKQLFDEEKTRRSGLGKIQASINTDAGTAAIDTKTEHHVDPLSLPETFGRYKVLRRLGAGAMGAVYLAHDTQLDRPVALKTPTFGDNLNDELIQRFYIEARAAANLRHPNICTVFDVGEVDGRHFITMDYIDGRPLSDFVNGTKPLEQRHVANTIRKLALAMAEAHQAGVIHRDLKPANIMIDRKGQPLVMDFGLARRDDEMQSRMTQSGMILGTPAYMPPEQVKGAIHEIGPQADIYSLGIVLYQLLTGRLPFEGSVAAVIGKILTEQPQPPSDFRRDIDPALQSICLKMIAKDSVDRYQSMEDVSNDLTDFLKGNSGSVDVLPIAAEPLNSGVPQTLEPLIQTDPLSLPVSSPAGPRPKPTLKTKSPFWKTPTGRYVAMGSALFGVLLIALSITLVFRTPYGTVTITTDDPDLIVEVDGNQINIRNDSPIRFADGSHELALRIGDQHLPIGDSETFEIAGREGEFSLSAKYGNTQLMGNEFTIDRGEKQALVISLTPEPELVQPALVANELVPALTVSGLELIRSRERKGHGPVLWMDFAPDGKAFASGSRGDKTVHVWNFRHDEVLATLKGHQNGVERVVYSPDGLRLASCDDSTILIWDLSSHNSIAKIEAPGVRVIDFAPNGKQLAWAGVDGRVRILETASWSESSDFSAHSSEIFSVAWSPDGNTLATASGDGTVGLWDAANENKLQLRFRGHEKHPISLAFSPDGSTLASFGVERSIKLWDVATGTRKLSIPTKCVGIRSLSFTPDGKVLAGGGVDRRLNLWDTETGKLIAQTPQGEQNILVSMLSPDGTTMISSSTDFLIRTWDVIRVSNDPPASSN